MKSTTHQSSRSHAKADEIELPYSKGKKLPVSRLLALLNGSIVIGKVNATEAKHPKKHSLDHWLRSFGRNPNVRQIDDKLVKEMEKTGFFRQTKIVCPLTGRLCNGIELTPEGRKQAETEKRSH
jgi:hypothetical protein